MHFMSSVEIQESLSISLGFLYFSQYIYVFVNIYVFVFVNIYVFVFMYYYIYVFVDLF